MSSRFFVLGDKVCSVFHRPFAAERTLHWRKKAATLQPGYLEGASGIIKYHAAFGNA